MEEAEKRWLIPDKDRCEWVKVSSGTSSPTKSQKKGHKTLVVVMYHE